VLWKEVTNIVLVNLGRRQWHVKRKCTDTNSMSYQ